MKNILFSTLFVLFAVASTGSFAGNTDGKPEAPEEQPLMPEEQLEEMKK